MTDEPTLVDQLSAAKAVVEYNPIEAGLAALRAELKGVVFDVTAKEGMEAARVARRKCVKLRTGLEALRERVKRPALEFGRLIDTEAKRIEGEIRQVEGPIDAQVKREEARIAEEAAALARAKAEAEKRIDDRIRWIADQRITAAKLTKASAADELLVQLQGLSITAELYGERRQEAVDTLIAVQTAVGEIGKALHEREAHAAELAKRETALQALERQRAEEDEARRIAHEREDAERAERIAREERRFADSLPPGAGQWNQAQELATAAVTAEASSVEAPDSASYVVHTDRAQLEADANAAGTLVRIGAMASNADEESAWETVQQIRDLVDRWEDADARLRELPEEVTP